MKIKLINKQTNEEHICSKVVIDGFDYYVNDKKNQVILGETYYENDNCIPIYSFTPETLPIEYYLQKIIATNNPSINLPKVIDEVEKLAKLNCPSEMAFENMFIRGYNKSQESHPFSEEDMIEFSWWLVKNLGMFSCDKTAHFNKEYLQIWKEQRIKTIYYEN